MKLTGLLDFDVPAEKRGDDRWDKINEAIDGLDISTRESRFWTPEGSLIGRPVWPREPLANVWLGISAEDQRRANERIPDLLATPAAVRFVSAEPLLGPIDLCALTFPKSCDCREHSPTLDAFEATVFCEGCCEGAEAMDLGRLDWIIIGGESGAGARPMENAWAQDIVDQCKGAGVAAFVKQLSSGGPKAIKAIDLFPPALRVRDLPRAAP